MVLPMRSAASLTGPPLATHAPTAADQALIQRFTDALWLEDGLAALKAKAYDLLNKGNTVGVFQLESGGMRDLCRKFGDVGRSRVDNWRIHRMAKSNAANAHRHHRAFAPHTFGSDKGSSARRTGPRHPYVTPCCSCLSP